MASRRRTQQDLDDERLRAALATYDENIGPITDTTRATYQRRLSQLQNGTKSSARRSSSAVSDGYTNLATLSSDDSDYDAGSSNQRSTRRRSAAAAATPVRRKANATTNTEKARRSLPASSLTRPSLRSRNVHTSTFADEFSDTDSDGALPSRSYQYQTPQASPLSYSRTPYQPPQTPSPQSYNSSSFLVHKFDETSRGNGYTALAEPKPRYQWVSFVLLLAAACFFVFLGAAYLGVRYPSHIGSLPPTDANTQGRPRADAPFNVTLCENNREKPCINEADVPVALELAGRTQKLLGRIAGDYECGNVPYRSLASASCLEFLRSSSASPIEDAAFKNCLLLLFENPAWGVKLLGPDKRPLDAYQQGFTVDWLEANQAVKSFWCCLRLAVHSFFYQILMAALVLVLFVVLYLGAVWYKARRDHWHVQVYNLAERITAVLKDHAEQPDCREPFLAQVHVRDMLISPSQRKEMGSLWQSAVAFLERNESRLRTERQQIEGETYLVWRWLGTASPPRAKVWQGKAFESQSSVSGAPLGLSCVPAPCLKIRHMFDPDVEYEDDWPKQIENAILEKCEGNTGIVHLHVDTSSREGCVYMKCANLDSAGQAYRALHGSWFDGNLITVKYLRLERYHDRFPEARCCYAPRRPSNSLRLSINSSPPHLYPPEEDTL